MAVGKAEVLAAIAEEREEVLAAIDEAIQKGKDSVEPVDLTDLRDAVRGIYNKPESPIEAPPVEDVPVEDEPDVTDTEVEEPDVTEPDTDEPEGVEPEGDEGEVVIEEPVAPEDSLGSEPGQE